jgi:Uma2 family endonuclease
MVAVQKRRWTAAEYLAFERASETKHEFVDGEVYMMAGASRAHNLILLNTASNLHQQLRPKSCEGYTNDMRVRVADEDFVYPDFVAVCGEPILADETFDTLLNPTLIIEVLSPSTQTYDRVGKFRLYRTLESLQEYLLVAQDEARIERFLRQPDGQWLFAEAVGLDAALELASIGCTLALADVYEKVTFAVEPSPDEPSAMGA